LREAGPAGVPFESKIADFGGVEVRRHRFPAGEAVVPGFGGHLVTLHLGAPTRAELRQGGLAATLTETEGNVMVVPAGVPAYQALFDPSEAVNVMLDGGLVVRLAVEAGGYSERVQVLGSFEDRDPRQSCWRSSRSSRAGAARAAPSTPIPSPKSWPCTCCATTRRSAGPPRAGSRRGTPSG
jgi:hypothetical protein